MLKKNAMRWVKALRSGKFKQAHNTLIDTDDDTDEVIGHCCLGVLGEINGFNKNGELIGSETLDMDSVHTLCDLRSDNAAPSTGKVKIKRKNRVATFDDLAEANDNGVGFRAIATWIEKNYKLL